MIPAKGYYDTQSTEVTQMAANYRSPQPGARAIRNRYDGNSRLARSDRRDCDQQLVRVLTVGLGGDPSDLGDVLALRGTDSDLRRSTARRYRAVRPVAAPKLYGGCRALVDETCDDCVYGARSHRANLLVGAVLHRVRNVDGRWIESERSRLPLGAVDERFGGDEYGGNPAALEVDDVVHTARRARSSIGERLDDRVAAGSDLVAEIDRCRLRERRLREALDLGSAFAQKLLHTVEKDVAARLGDVEEAEPPPCERRESRDPRPDRQRALARRIEQTAARSVVGSTFPSLPLVAPRDLAGQRTNLCHGALSFRAGVLPTAPRAHPPIITGKSPAGPPA